jgi:hypothetical protein
MQMHIVHHYRVKTERGMTAQKTARSVAMVCVTRATGGIVKDVRGSESNCEHDSREM